MLILGFFLMNSCEKVIEFNLDGSKEAIVIEANIISSKNPYTVNISKTSPFFETKTSNPVSGAKVSIRAERGKQRYFQEKKPGVYVLDKVIASTGVWYIVDVEYEGIVYSARSYLNESVPIVDLGFSYFDGLGFFENGYKVFCYIVDPADRANFYRIKYFVNGTSSNALNEASLYSDKLFNGMEIGLGQRTLIFKETDTLSVELESIDEAAYNYFSTLESITGTDWHQSAAPANPSSNFNNGALGYFSIYSVSTKTAIIKDYIKK